MRAWLQNPASETVKPGDRVAVNVETFCGHCFFCQHGFVNNCTDPNGGWALGCRIDGGQAEYVRVPYADQGLTVIPDRVSDRQALFAGDVLATGYWAVRISEIRQGDTVLILGAGPTGICTMLCAMLHHPHRIIICDPDPARLRYLPVLSHEPEGSAWRGLRGWAHEAARDLFDGDFRGLKAYLCGPPAMVQTVSRCGYCCGT